MKINGRITYWNPFRHFGIVEYREACNGGFKLTNYFLHRSKIVFMMSEPQIDCFARFESSKPAPLRPDLLCEALNVEVYQTMEQLEAAEKEPKAGA